MLGRIIPYVKSKLHGVLSLHATPHQVALGISTGVFVGIFPTFGFGAIIIVFVSPILRCNIPAALLGTLAGNPLLSPLWISLSCLVGGIEVSAIKAPEDTFLNIAGHYSELLVRYVIANGLISTSVAVFCYFPAVQIVTKYRQRKAARALEK